MNKRQIQVYQVFANVFPGVYNFPVYILLHEGWSNFSLQTCINCGELFVIDWENPQTKELSVLDIIGQSICPICNLYLRDTIRNYPQTIKLQNDQIGSFNTRNYLPTDIESLVVEVFEIKPNMS